MKTHGIAGILVLLLLLVAGLVPQQTYAEAADYDIPNGHFYSQAAGPEAIAGQGYTITDEDVDSRGQTIRFWSEFKRLGGVSVLGYPASRRFQWNGFTCQVIQRVVFQWRPETNSVAFVNVMDLITQAGKDDYLLNVRQTPRPANFLAEEQGMSFQQIMTKRYALLDAYPAIKARFFAVSDPLALHGLPTAPISDMGDAYVLRAQRIIIQQWKKDMPWARAGEVTLALGGDIAKEVGLVVAQNAQAVLPGTLAELLAKPVPTPTPVPPTPTPVVTGPMWRIIEARYLTPCENHGMHHLFVEVYDVNGAPLNGVVVVFKGNTGLHFAVSGDKGPGRTEFNLFRDGGVTYIEGGNSEVSPIFTTNIPKDEPCVSGADGNTWFHYSYKVVFKKAY